MGALEGLKVVDLSRVLAGPLCTQILADQGAEVIKIEPPSGDETRGLGPPYDVSGHAAYYSALNRGKRAMSLNLSDPESHDILERLLEDADVLVENFLPGTMERWGLGFEDVLSKRYPKLIYCAISGFGSDGPLGGLPGYDAVVQAICGLMSINGDERSGATRVGLPVVDHLTGYVALSGILMALYKRGISGLGARVEATLFDTALSMLLPHGVNFLASGKEPRLLGSAHPNIAPYDKFKTNTGEVFIGILNNKQFAKFCDYLDKGDWLLDERFATPASRLINRLALTGEIESAIAEHDGASLCEDLMRAGVPAGAVNTVSGALAQAHAQHRQSVISKEAYRGLRSPMVIDGHKVTGGRAPPDFSQDTTQILSELGFDEGQIKALLDKGVVFPPAS